MVKVMIKTNLKNKTVMALDTSINTAGVAIFKKGKPIFYDLLKPVLDKSKIISTDQKVKTSKKSLDYVDKSKSIFVQAFKLTLKYHPDVIVVEVPEYYGVSAYLARESGSLFKLTFVSGMLMALPNAIAINPTTWKMQMPKVVVQNRLNLTYPKLDIMGLDHNIVDALGIAYWTIYGKV
jgi:hypothetical protein